MEERKAVQLAKQLLHVCPRGFGACGLSFSGCLVLPRCLFSGLDRRLSHRFRLCFRQGLRWLHGRRHDRGGGHNWRRQPTEFAPPRSKPQLPRMREHGLVTLVVGHDHERAVRLARRDVPNVVGQLKIQRISARAGARDQRHALGHVGLLVPRSVHFLLWAMEQPHIRALRLQLPEFLALGLHVFPIDEQVHPGGRRGRSWLSGVTGRRRLQFNVLRRVLAGVLAQLVLHGLFQIHTRMVSQLQQVKQHVCDLIGHALLVARVARDTTRFGQRRPLENLQQLRRLHHQRHRQVFGRVARLPIPGCGKTTQPDLQSLVIHSSSPLRLL